MAFRRGGLPLFSREKARGSIEEIHLQGYEKVSRRVLQEK